MEKGALTEYLKNVMILETKAQEIEQEIDNINEAKNTKLKSISVSYGRLSEPEKPNVPAPDYRPETDYEIDKVIDSYGGAKGFALVQLYSITVIVGILAIAMFAMKLFIPGVVCLVIAALPFLWRAKIKNDNRSFALNKIREENDEKRREYDKKVREEEEKYNQKKRTYDSKMQDIKKREEEAQIHNEKATIARNELNPIISELKKNLAEVKDKLQEYYGLDVIFGKYRGLVPVSMMYEYLASSRCSSLEGPDGAYNLYEAEIRQNIIIVQLQTIISQLESIKQNQYCLYQQLKEIEGNTREMNNSLNKISSDVDRIKDVSAYSASVQTQTMYMTANIEKQLDNIHGLQIASFFLK